jgi:hypothetical protein
VKEFFSDFTETDEELEVVLGNGQVLMYLRGSSIASAKVIGIRHGKLYRLCFKPLRALAHSNSSDLCELWHRRMAHSHHGALQVRRKIVTGLPDLSTEHHEVCKGCALGKYTKTAFPSSDSRVGGVLDLVHSDVCGPMSAVSLSGYEYYVTFISYFSRKTRIYFMKTKGQVFSRFKEFQALV